MSNPLPTAELKEIFAQRFFQARKMRGLSLRELGSRLKEKVSYNALHKYEQGKMMPGSDLLIRISECLSLAPDFFFRPIKVSLSGIEFRKKTSLGSKEEAAIKEKAAEFFERYLEVEEILGTAGKFRNPLAGRDIIRTPAEAEKAAMDLRAAWKLGMDALPGVINLLEENHVKVFEVDAEKSFDGFGGHTGDIPIIVINRNQPADRKRLTALHELGHLILEFSGSTGDGKVKEKLCSRFAGALLLPAARLKMELGEKRTRITEEELVDIKKRYGISCAAIMMLAGNIGIFSGSQMQLFWQSWSARGYRKKEPGDFTMQEAPQRFEQLVIHGVAEELLSQTKGAALLGKPLAEFRERLKVIP